MELGTSDASNKWKTALNIFVLAISLFVVAKTDKPVQQTTIAEEIIISTFGPLQSLIYRARVNLKNYVTDYILNANASEKNRTLKTEIENLNTKLMSMDELHKESQRLKTLLDLPTETQYKKIVARIIGWDASSDEKSLRINRGKKDGLTLQSPVITSTGLVGYVYRLSHSYADVLTILDPDNRVDAYIERTRSHGIVEGYSRGRCYMKYISGREPIVLNDIVYTSGLGLLYPKGIPVGKVTHLERETYAITQHVEISPAVNFGTIEEVVVLLAKEMQPKKNEIQALNVKKNEEKQK